MFHLEETCIMTELQRIQRLILEATSVLGRETVPILESLGRVLAVDTVAAEDIPGVDISAVDGFAVFHGSLQGASTQSPVPLRIIGESPAGRPFGTGVGRGEAVRIMTGGVIPDGADAVVKREDAEERGSLVVFAASHGPGGNIRFKGEALKRGETVLFAGEVIGAVEVCKLASLRRSHVLVHQKPVVAIISTGDELTDFHEPSLPGKIMCSTLYGLAAQVLETGAVPLLLGVAQDDPAEQRKLLSEGLRADVVITSGGIANGKYDLMRQTFRAVGVDIKFTNIALKPNKPAVFGAINGTLIFGFPGNPSAGMISFEQFVRPALLKMMGRNYFDEVKQSFFSSIDSFRPDLKGGGPLRASLVPDRGPATGKGKPS